MGYNTTALSTVDGSNVSNVADGSVVGGLYVIHTAKLVAGAIGNTDIVLPRKTRIVNVQTILQGAGVLNCTLQIKNGTDAITEAIDISGADKSKNWAYLIDDAYWDIAAGGTLRITTATGATQPDVYVIVQGMLVA